MRARGGITSLIVCLLAGAISAPAQVPEPASAPEPAPGWQVCNETSFILRTAVATQDDDKMVPRGWIRLRPGECSAVDAPKDTPRYVYAESSGMHQGGIREWKGSVPLCVDDTDFVANSNIGCALQDMDTRQYIPVDPAEPVMTFVEPSGYGVRAQTAGLQRLLKDNNLSVSRIDGVAGRRTSRTLRKFLKDNNLPADLSAEAQIDALETAGFTHIKSIGLTLCNKSSQKVWAAIGKRYDQTWESRGWWEIEVGTCLQPITETLLKADAHFFAQQDGALGESGKRGEGKDLRVVAAAPSQFCIAEARFSSLGRENCVDNGYEAASFRVLPIDKVGVTVNLTDADFAAPSSTGLRQ